MRRIYLRWIFHLVVGAALLLATVIVWNQIPPHQFWPIFVPIILMIAKVFFTWVDWEFGSEEPHRPNRFIWLSVAFFAITTSVIAQPWFPISGPCLLGAETWIEIWSGMKPIADLHQDHWLYLGFWAGLLVLTALFPMWSLRDPMNRKRSKERSNSASSSAADNPDSTTVLSQGRKSASLSYDELFQQLMREVRKKGANWENISTVLLALKKDDNPRPAFFFLINAYHTNIGSPIPTNIGKLSASGDWEGDATEDENLRKEAQKLFDSVINPKLDPISVAFPEIRANEKFGKLIEEAPTDPVPGHPGVTLATLIGDLEDPLKAKLAADPQRRWFIQRLWVMAESVRNGSWSPDAPNYPLDKSFREIFDRGIRALSGLTLIKFPKLQEDLLNLLKRKGLSGSASRFSGDARTAMQKLVMEYQRASGAATVHPMGFESEDEEKALYTAASAITSDPKKLAVAIPEMATLQETKELLQSVQPIPLGDGKTVRGELLALFDATLRGGGGSSEADVLNVLFVRAISLVKNHAWVDSLADPKEAVPNQGVEALRTLADVGQWVYFGKFSEGVKHLIDTPSSPHAVAEIEKIKAYSNHNAAVSLTIATLMYLRKMNHSDTPPAMPRSKDDKARLLREIEQCLMNREAVRSVRARR